MTSQKNVLNIAVAINRTNIHRAITSNGDGNFVSIPLEFVKRVFE
jgi:hypothetical protein